MLTKIGHLFSEETQLALLPIDVDYEAEQERKIKEKEAGYSFPLMSGEEDGLLEKENAGE